MALGGAVVIFAFCASTRPRRRIFDQARDVRVSVLRVALDMRARAIVQDELAEIARDAVTTNGEGRVVILHEAAMVLRRLAYASAYVGGVTEAPTTRQSARKSFQAHVANARALTVGERIRNTPRARRTPIEIGGC